MSVNFECLQTSGSTSVERPRYYSFDDNSANLDRHRDVILGARVSGRLISAVIINITIRVTAKRPPVGGEGETS